MHFIPIDIPILLIHMYLYLQYLLNSYSVYMKLSIQPKIQYFLINLFIEYFKQQKQEREIHFKLDAIVRDKQWYYFWYYM